jgi:hypothetical protein
MKTFTLFNWTASILHLLSIRITERPQMNFNFGGILHANHSIITKPCPTLISLCLCLLYFIWSFWICVFEFAPWTLFLGDWRELSRKLGAVIFWKPLFILNFLRFIMKVKVKVPPDVALFWSILLGPSFMLLVYTIFWLVLRVASVNSVHCGRTSFG